MIVENMGLNITVFSYLDRIDFGLHVDPDLVPDVWDVAERDPRRGRRVARCVWSG